MAQSEVFKAMFETDWNENKDIEVKIVNIEYEPMLAFVKFLYFGRVDFSKGVEFAFKVLKAADKYNVQKLRAVCTEFISSRLTQDNVLMVINQAG